MKSWGHVEAVAGRLSTLARQQRYNVHEEFRWPQSLPSDAYWMSPELTTCYGTSVWDRLSEPERLRLSQAEAVNFFSLNVHLIRGLIGEVADRIYTTRYPGLSEFFHDFIHEENEHMWFFARFCELYGGKVYPTRAVSSHASAGHEAIQDVVVFGRILIAEELCDVFNARMATDDRLPEIARRINAVHHQDESRHIAFGRQMMTALLQEAREQAAPSELEAAGAYLFRYISACVRSFYNPSAYADAGLPTPLELRGEVLNHPYRSTFHREILGRTCKFLARIGLPGEEALVW
ncbi:diiron oxygenase [Streptomyces silvisoli]|uniref:Diiron oxygenase n=1 Tax=Streptomyces silvisoli TaxID=3034235 RepID=A0ABT5ZMQ4_9ACTN|nr:diiron oxygenase [Streptomyces silvisoli]MDF3290288.1 diiron oxygenase [Streptomyces silvisoli]